jgi:hypothetical protein
MSLIGEFSMKKYDFHDFFEADKNSQDLGVTSKLYVVPIFCFFLTLIGAYPMRKLRVALTSLFVALLCMTTAFAQGQTIVNDLVVKNKKHRHHHDSESSSSSSSSSEHERRGPRGRHGKRGHRGHRGNAGQTGSSVPGPAGSAGSAGAPGPAGVSGAITSFISAYEVAGGTLIPLGANILWSTTTPHIVDQTSDFSLNSATGQFTSTAGAGNYEVFYGAKWSGATAFQLFVNGSAVPGSILQPLSNNFSSLSIVVNVLNSNPTFEIRNIDTSTAANLNPGAPNTTTGAFITIKKLS